jgi:hypothetical protein
MAAQWQGALLWWSFDPEGKVARHVEASLRTLPEGFAGLIDGPPERLRRAGG